MVRERLVKLNVSEDFRRFVKIESAKRDQKITEFCDNLKSMVNGSDNPKKVNFWGKI